MDDSRNFYFIYLDEAGDDGWPKYSSELFVLSAIYFHFNDWQRLYDQIHNFRKKIKLEHGLPVKMEMHTRKFLLNKNPYNDLNYDAIKRREIFEEFIGFIADLDIKSVNVCINKRKIDPKKITGDYPVLDKALTFCIQRVENDLVRNDKNAKAIIIADEGRIGKMTRTIREMRQINFIPSKFYVNPYRNELRSIIEDPLPKQSQQSYFIQIADLLSHLVYLHFQIKHHGRFDEVFPNFAKGKTYLEILKRKVFNLKAAGDNPYGIYCHPK